MATKLEVELDDGETRVMTLLGQAHREKETLQYVRIEYWGDESGVTLTHEQYDTVFECIGALPNVKEIILHFTHEAPPLPARALQKLIYSTANTTTTAAKKLDFLSLCRVRLSGRTEEFDALSETLRNNQSLKNIHVFSCQSVVLAEDQNANQQNGLAIPAEEEDIDIYPVEGSNSTQFVDYGINAFLQALANLPTLESLHLDGVQHLSENTLTALCLSRNLQKLELLRMGKDLNAHGPAMASALETNQSSLTVFEISSNLQERAGNAILRMLQVNTTLDTLGLDLDYCDYGEALAEALVRNNSTIKTLHLRLVGEIQQTEGGDSTEEKVLSNAKKIIQALKENTNLEHLHVNFYHISPIIVSLSLVDLFEDLLQSNFVLAHLSLRGKHSIVNLGPELHFSLKLNQMGRLQWFERNRDEWVETIVEHQQDLSVVYYLLSARPTICTNEDV